MADPRKFFVPAAEKYSAQQIADVTTPDGQAAMNEEFRRIQSAIHNITTQEPAPTPATDTQSGGGATSVPAVIADKKLSVEHNSITVVPNITEILNFEDSDTIQFDVQYSAAKTARIQAKGRTSSFAGYRARKIGEILYSVDGRVFTPEWPLTSETQGVLLADNGIIMIWG